MNQRKAGVVLSYTTQAIKMLSSLLYTPIVLRLLGQSEYGLYQLVGSIVAYLGLLSFGFSSSYIRFYSRVRESGDDEDVARLNGMFMTVFLIIAAVAAISGTIMVQNIHGIFGSGLTESEYKTAKILMMIMVYNVVINFPNSVFTCIISSQERFFFQRLLSLLQTLLNPFLGLPLLLMGYGSIGLVVVTTVLTMAKIGLDIWYVFAKLHTRFVFKGFDFSLFRDLGTFTFFIFLNQIINQVNWGVDRFLLGRMIGTAAVAIYGLGAQINNIFINFSTIISSVFSPQIHRIVVKGNDNHELSELMIRVGRIQFFVLSLILTGFIFVGKPFMIIWGGSNEYAESYYVALLLIVPVIVPLIQNIGIEIQRAKNMHKARSVVYSCIAIANIIISIPLIRWLGPRGAAWGTAISLVCGNIIFMNWYYAKRIGLEIGAFWRSIFSIFPALIMPCILGVVMMQFFPPSRFRFLLLEIIIYTAVFSISMWKFGMNEYERSLVYQIINKIKRRKNDKDQ